MRLQAGTRGSRVLGVEHGPLKNEETQRATEGGRRMSGWNAPHRLGTLLRHPDVGWRRGIGSDESSPRSCGTSSDAEQDR